MTMTPNNDKCNIQNDKDFIIIKEDEDIILPDTVWGEIIYICFVLKHIIFHSKNKKNDYKKLLCQIRIYKKWREMR